MIIRIPLNDPTARLVHEGANAILIPLKRKPPEYDSYSDIEYEFIITGLNRPPCQVGDMLYLLETWAEAYGLFNHEKVIVYKTDNIISYIDYTSFKKWRSPVTMPNSVCRHKYPCTKVEAIRENEIWKWLIELERKGL